MIEDVEMGDYPGGFSVIKRVLGREVGEGQNWGGGVRMEVEV